MTLIPFESLQPEFISNQTTWLDFMAALAEVIQEQIRDPIKEIEDIRHITEDTDPQVIVNTIKQLGFDLPADIIKHNADRLAKSVYMLALVHETSGTRDFQKAVSFVLGREVNVYNLYTNNYQDFYTSPFGPMIADGGDWYKTTHIELEMEIVPSDANLIIPEGKTLADRLMDAYYEFAPINHVVERFYYLINLAMGMGITGKVVRHAKDYITVGRGTEEIVGIKIAAPLMARAGTSVQLYADLVLNAATCYNIEPPIYGYAPAGIDSDSEFFNLMLAFPSTSNQSVSFSVPENMYLYVAYQKPLGPARFVDDALGIEGGMDGATWTEDGSIGDGAGPMVITRDVNGIEQEWYLYRSDFPGIGDVTFNISFRHAGRKNSCDPVVIDPGGVIVDPDPTPDPDPQDGECVDVTRYLNPVYGSGDIGYDSDAEVKTLAFEFPTTDSRTIALSVPDGKYGYLCYPTQLGLATFYDVNAGFEGGWDGAGWPDDGGIGSTFGPIVITRTFGGQIMSWYLYRTDFPGIGNVTFDVTFENPGVEISYVERVCDDDASPCVEVTRSLFPKYGTSELSVDTDAEIAGLQFEFSSTFDQRITISIPDGDFGYFSYPVALGEAVFVDPDVGIAGGWDGASWPTDGTIGDNMGPIVVTRTHGEQTVDWYVYRTDFSSLGERRFDVTFANPGIDVTYTELDCDSQEPPVEEPPPVISDAVVFGVAPFGVDTSTEIDQYLTEELGATNSFTITVPSGHHGYFAHPASLGFAFFTDLSTELEGGWDGANWPEDGSIGEEFGPIVIYRRVNNELQTWYLYRTDFPGIGTKTFSVTYGSLTDFSGGQRVVRVVLPQWSTDRPDIVSISETGNVTFAPVYRETTVTISVTYNGHTTSTQILLKPTLPRIDSIRIEGPASIVGGQSAIYRVEGYFADGSVRLIEDAEFTVLSPYAFADHYTVNTNNPPEDDTVFLRARVVDDGIEHIAAKDVALAHVSAALSVTSLSISGSGTIDEGQTLRYTAIATFSDGTSKPVPALWESSSPDLYVDQEGDVTAGRPISGFDAKITATYQFAGKKVTAERTVSVMLVVITPTQLSITGPTTVMELSEAKYIATMKWSNGAVTQVQADWKSSKFSIDESGLLITGSVGNAISITLEAVAEGLSATLNVSVYATPIDIEYITIVGPDNVREGVVGQYTAYAHYNDGRDVQVTPAWSIAGNPGYATIGADGRMSFENARQGILEIQAKYDDGIKIFSQTKPVVLIPNVSLITGLVVTGPSEVLEGKRISLSATAIYDDGTMEPVTPVWGVRSSDPLNDPEAAADIVSPGVVQGRHVASDTVVVVEARYFKEIAEFPIIVKNYEAPGPDVPVSYRVLGPALLRANEIGSYALMCVFDNTCAQEIALSNDWSLDVSPDVAVIDENGFLRSISGETADVTVIATWEFAGHYIRQEYPVRIVSTQSTLQELVVYGPSSIEENSITQYRTELFRTDQPVVEGTGETKAVEWSIDTQIPYVSISSAGSLYVGDVPFGTQIVIRARYEEDFHFVEKTHVVSVGQMAPMFGVGPAGVSSGADMDLYLTQGHDRIENGQEFSVTAGALEYVYYAYPASAGIARFLDTGIDIEGGMDGATWPLNGSVGSTRGPLVISRTRNGIRTDWYLYRSDFPGIGTVNFRVTYDAL